MFAVLVDLPLEKLAFTLEKPGAKLTHALGGQDETRQAEHWTFMVFGVFLADIGTNVAKFVEVRKVGHRTGLFQKTRKHVLQRHGPRKEGKHNLSNLRLTITITDFPRAVKWEPDSPLSPEDAVNGGQCQADLSLESLQPPDSPELRPVLGSCPSRKQGPPAFSPSPVTGDTTAVRWRVRAWGPSGYQGPPDTPSAQKDGVVAGASEYVGTRGAGRLLSLPP